MSTSSSRTNRTGLGLAFVVLVLAFGAVAVVLGADLQNQGTVVGEQPETTVDQVSVTESLADLAPPDVSVGEQAGATRDPAAAPARSAEGAVDTRNDRAAAAEAATGPRPGDQDQRVGQTADQVPGQNQGPGGESPVAGGIRAIATTATSYSCPDGSTGAPTEADPSCHATTGTTSAATSSTTYSCPAGSTSTGSGAALICTTSETNFEPVDVIVTAARACPAGARFVSGEGCLRSSVVHIVVPATGARTYSCPAAATQSGAGATTTCEIVVQRRIDQDSTHTPVYSCPAGANGVGSQQSLVCTTRSGDEVQSEVRVQLGCPADSATPTPPCYREIPHTVDVDRVISFTYSCPADTSASGSGADQICGQVETRDEQVPYVSTTNDSCPEGAQPNRTDPLQCFQPVTTETVVDTFSRTSYTCGAGTTASGSGPSTTCTASAEEVVAAVATKTTSFSCPAGTTGSPTATNPWCG